MRRLTHNKCFAFFSLAAVAVILCLSLVATSASANPGTATLTKPTDITLGASGTFIVGANLGHSTTAGSVVADTAGWSLTVSDAKTLATGYMTLGGADNVSLRLAAPILVGMTAGSGNITAYQTALQADTAHGYGLVGTFSIPLYVSQTVAAADPVGSYKITLTYVATPGG